MAFQKLSYQYLTYDNRHTFYIKDSCLGVKLIYSPRIGPGSIKNPIANAIATMSLIKYYDINHRNIGLNLALYYVWLVSQEYIMNPNIIKQQLEAISLARSCGNVMRYYNTILSNMKYITDASIKTTINNVELY